MWEPTSDLSWFSEGRWQTLERRWAGWNIFYKFAKSPSFLSYHVNSVCILYTCIVHACTLYNDQNIWVSHLLNCEQMVSGKRCQPCLWSSSQLGRGLGQNDGEWCPNQPKDKEKDKDSGQKLWWDVTNMIHQAQISFISNFILQVKIEWP